LVSVTELSPENRVHIEVDRGLCIGSGDCVDTAPDVFELDSEEKAVVVDPDGASVDDLVQAAANCPVSAITVVGEDGELYP
jgi:ferredoxin